MAGFETLLALSPVIYGAIRRLLLANSSDVSVSIGAIVPMAIDAIFCRMAGSQISVDTCCSSVFWTNCSTYWRLYFQASRNPKDKAHRNTSH